MNYEPFTSIENLTLAHFRHFIRRGGFSSLFTNLPAYKAADIYVPIRHYICREPSTNHLFLCKTNPILSAVGGLQMNVSIFLQMAYENKHNWTLSENKPNQTHFQNVHQPPPHNSVVHTSEPEIVMPFHLSVSVGMMGSYRPSWQLPWVGYNNFVARVPAVVLPDKGTAGKGDCQYRKYDGYY